MPMVLRDSANMQKYHPSLVTYPREKRCHEFRKKAPLPISPGNGRTNYGPGQQEPNINSVLS
jgi:hypothetical protein